MTPGVRVRAAGAVRGRDRGRARGADVLPAGPRRRPAGQRRPGEGSGVPARGEAGGAARRGAAPVRRGRARRLPAAADDNEPLDLPLDEEFRVGTLGLAWDGDTDTVVIEAIAVGEYEADEPTEEELAELDRLRVRLTPAATRAFIARAKRVVAAGRPPCPFCGQPLDPDGHLCPRHNGYRR